MDSGNASRADAPVPALKAALSHFCLPLPPGRSWQRDPGVVELGNGQPVLAPCTAWSKFPRDALGTRAFRSSVGRTAAAGVHSAMPLCERLADDTQDGAPVLRGQFEPLPEALPG